MVNTVPNNLEDDCGIFQGIIIKFTLINRKSMKTSVRMASNLVYIQTGYLLNTSLQPYNTINLMCSRLQSLCFVPFPIFLLSSSYFLEYLFLLLNLQTSRATVLYSIDNGHLYYTELKSTTAHTQLS
jgi:hypothetical protein